MHYNAMTWLFSETQCNTVQCNTKQNHQTQYNTIQTKQITQSNTILIQIKSNAIHCKTIQYNATQQEIKYNTIRYSIAQCNAIKCKVNSLQYARYNTPPHNAMQYMQLRIQTQYKITHIHRICYNAIHIQYTCDTIQCSTIQCKHNTIQYIAMQYNTIRNNTIATTQYNTYTM